jgi:hypothetical protein
MTLLFSVKPNKNLKSGENLASKNLFGFLSNQTNLSGIPASV